MTYDEKVRAVEPLKYYVEDDGKIVAFVMTLDQAFAVKQFMDTVCINGKKPSGKVSVRGGE